MLEYDRIHVSEGIDVNRCEDTSRKCSLCQYYYGCHMSVRAIIMKHLTIIYHGGHAYRVNYVFMSRNDAFNLIKNSIIIDKRGTL